MRYREATKQMEREYMKKFETWLQHITQSRKENKLAYICSPYKGNVLQRFRNIRYARRLTRNAVRLGFAPVATHLYLTQVLDDNRPKERGRGMKAGLSILSACDVLIVGTRYGVSEGMAAEIEHAQKNGITIIWILGGISCYTP